MKRRARVVVALKRTAIRRFTAPSEYRVIEWSRCCPEIGPWREAHVFCQTA